MNEFKGTPGPWSFTADGAWIEAGPTYSNGEMMAVASLCAYCEAHGTPRIANARLIASAPDLLADLAQAAEWFEDYAREHYAKARTAPDGREQHGREVKGKANADRAKQLRAAIAKATGA